MRYGYPTGLGSSVEDSARRPITGQRKRGAAEGNEAKPWRWNNSVRRRRGPHPLCLGQIPYPSLVIRTDRDAWRSPRSELHRCNHSATMPALAQQPIGISTARTKSPSPNLGPGQSTRSASFRWLAARVVGVRPVSYCARAAAAFLSLNTGCMRVLLFFDPATFVFGRLAESGIAARAFA